MENVFSPREVAEERSESFFFQESLEAEGNIVRNKRSQFNPFFHHNSRRFIDFRVELET